MNEDLIGRNADGRETASGLITAILAYAGEQGVDQRTLAARAGISAETLSRLKKKGNCRLRTALDLAHAVGLELAPAPASSRSAARIAARELSAGRRQPIDARELVTALASGNPKRGFNPHLFGFFEELPVPAVHDVILEEDLEFDCMLKLALALGAEGETVDWLAEMAGYRLAPAP